MANWDTNGDGELNMGEVATVTKLDDTFVKTGISSFDEFRFSRLREDETQMAASFRNEL